MRKFCTKCEAVKTIKENVCPQCGSVLERDLTDDYYCSIGWLMIKLVLLFIVIMGIIICMMTSMGLEVFEKWKYIFIAVSVGVASFLSNQRITGLKQKAILEKQENRTK